MWWDVCVRVHTCGHACTHACSSNTCLGVHMETRKQLARVDSFLLQCEFGGWIQIVSCDSKGLYPLSRLTGPCRFVLSVFWDRVFASHESIILLPLWGTRIEIYIFSRDKVSLTPDWPWMCYVVKDDLRLLFLLSPPPKCWGYRRAAPTPVERNLFYVRALCQGLTKCSGLNASFKPHEPLWGKNSYISWWHYEGSVVSNSGRRIRSQ